MGEAPFEKHIIKPSKLLLHIMFFTFLILVIGAAKRMVENRRLRQTAFISLTTDFLTNQIFIYFVHMST